MSEPAATAETPLAERVDRLAWYHTIDLPDGVTTPGYYDLRPIMPRLPMPSSLEGLRCLDVGTRNGFYAFEMERRGASEVVALDLDDPDEIQYPLPRPHPELIRTDLQIGRTAFDVAHQALGSGVERRPTSVYRLDESVVGRFDFAVVGTLLWHLRDPVAALASVASVLDGRLLVNEGISTMLSVLAPFAGVAEVKMERGRPFWWAANRAGLEKMVVAAGLDVRSRGRPYLVPHGPGKVSPSWRWALTAGGPGRFLERLVLKHGALQAWLLAAPGPAELTGPLGRPPG